MNIVLLVLITCSFIANSFKIDQKSSVCIGNRVYFQRRKDGYSCNRLTSLNGFPAEYNADLSRIGGELAGLEAALDTIELPKVVTLRPTNGKGGKGRAESERKEGDGGGIGGQGCRLALPNTRLVTGGVGPNQPVLAIDLGASVGLSFNFGGQFELLPRLRFGSYRRLAARILGLARSVKQRHSLGGLAVLVGFPLLGDAHADLRLLFQLLYTLDFSCYLAHCLNKLFNPRLDGSGSHNYPDSATTHCLYCSIMGGHSTSNSSSADSPGLCRISGRNCSQTVDLASLRHFVLGVSEHLSTYQTAGLSAGAAAAQSVPYSIKALNRHSLSSLNIYYNLLASTSGGGSSPTVTSPTSNASGLSNSSSQPFLVLPNRTHVFDAKSRHNNILLYRRLKSLILAK